MVALPLAAQDLSGPRRTAPAAPLSDLIGDLDEAMQASTHPRRVSRDGNRLVLRRPSCIRAIPLTHASTVRPLAGSSGRFLLSLTTEDIPLCGSPDLTMGLLAFLFETEADRDAALRAFRAVIAAWPVSAPVAQRQRPERTSPPPRQRPERATPEPRRSDPAPHQRPRQAFADILNRMIAAAPSFSSIKGRAIPGAAGHFVSRVSIPGAKTSIVCEGGPCHVNSIIGTYGSGERQEALEAFGILEASLTLTVSRLDGGPYTSEPFAEGPVMIGRVLYAEGGPLLRTMAVDLGSGDRRYAVLLEVYPDLP